MEPADQNLLLRVAADTVRATIAHSPLPPLNQYPWSNPTHCGAFVTLHTAGRLRGCVGTFFAQEPLPATVREMALSALDDPRFEEDRIAAAELDAVEIEISVVSPLKRTNDPLSLQVGVHGVYVRVGGRSGCFLPQVATEAGWDAKTLLSKVCQTKAQTIPDAWRDADAEVYLFTTECFAARLCEVA